MGLYHDDPNVEEAMSRFAFTLSDLESRTGKRSTVIFISHDPKERDTILIDGSSGLGLELREPQKILFATALALEEKGKARAANIIREAARKCVELKLD